MRVAPPPRMTTILMTILSSELADGRTSSGADGCIEGAALPG